MKRKIWVFITTFLLFSSLGIASYYGNTFDSGKTYEQNKLIDISSETNYNSQKAVANRQTDVLKDLVGEKMSDNLISKDNLVGTWKLADFYTVDGKQKIDYPYGKNPTGYLVYTENGYVSVTIMTTDRPLLGLSMEEMQELKDVKLGLKLIANLGKSIKASLRYFSAARNYLSYSGKYELRDSTVIHHVEVSVIPDWVGVDLERNVEFSEGKIILSNNIKDVFFSVTWKLVS
ncbi:lipocalin-like domain-containing protein [Hydrocoleum sp. CS-953]|uniref:lipocalin-like domain-containing protein n=1 Tax=Hydrocoleum sp. CS-953 TaxID=1671698 RepID=UPI001AEFAFFD|nr:lipocalin-like domain-containing protein [Hydrocoleum sp. CS-953]